MKPNKQLTNKPDNAEVVGKTIWDVLVNLFTRKPRIIIAILTSFIFIAIILFLTGVLKFKNGKLSIGIDEKSMVAASAMQKESDEITAFCIENGKLLNKKYVIKSVTQISEIETYGKHHDSLHTKRRISYDVLALQDISMDENIFKENYFTDEKTERWYGNDKEQQVEDGNDETYYVHFACKKGDSHTVITGVDYYVSRDTASRGYWLNYPNDEDVIGKLTMIVSSKSLKLQVFSNSAVHTSTSPRVRVIDEKDAYYNFDGTLSHRYNSVSYTWTKMLPNEEVLLLVTWR